MRAILYILMVMALYAARSTFAGDGTYKITYISAEHVYIDGGSEDGLNAGDTLRANGTGPDTVLVELLYTAGHSSSGRKISGNSRLSEGDRLVVHARTQAGPDLESASAVSANSINELAADPIEITDFPDEPPASTLIKGTLSFGLYHWSDHSPANLDFTQTSTRLNMKVHHLWDEHVTLIIRSRGRYDARDRAYSSVGRSEWENRLWELSLVYDNDAKGLYIAAGRILPKRMAAAGYLDGAVVEYEIGRSLHIGLMAGSEPDWMYRTSGPSLNRAGGYMTLLAGAQKSFYFEQTLAVIGEMHSDRISRSYMVSSGRLSYSSRWGINHTTEIDINTGWRKDRTGESVAVSRAYVYGYYRLNRALRLGLSYDNLKRYWTYEYMSVADSLFDDRSRQGWRARAEVSPGVHWYLSGSFGLRNHPDAADPTTAFSVNLRRSKFIRQSASLALMYSGFNGPHEHGTNYSGQLQIITIRPGVMHFGYGRYQYAVDEVNEDRSSWYLESGVDTDIGKNYYIGGSVQYNTGADIDGWRYRAEFGYRL